ncbi:TonB-dependent receptor [Membranihabitans maritimus]|uniref:TonB-dependent receptor n=1 Tax=Membranihabitans maritimus TaxID=2904244 RepID=UPI001F410F99|nr:TonB-dependent receptor [Membranihabitans maritimus]
MRLLETTALLFINISFLFSQDITISGNVEEISSGEKIIGANILEVNSLSGGSTNEYGFYSISLPVGEINLVVSYVGFQSDTIQFNSSTDTVINVRLSRAVLLDELVVKAEKANRIEEESQMSRNEIPVEQIKKLPAFLGETDVLKTLQLMPGVQSGAEGTSGIFVRGGSIDQNLILVDGVPIYNPTHVLGIFSSFNSDAIKNVSITKGGFPARYGGRLSSVVEVNMKDGHLNEFHGSGQIGLISSKLLLEGPIIPEKSSFLVSMRRSYIDIIGRPIAKAVQSGNQGKVLPTAFFHDLNAKANYELNDRHRLVFSGYYGADHYGVKYNERYEDGSNEATDARVKWGNYIGSLNWNHRMSSKMFANTTLTYSRYRLNNDVLHSYEEEDFEEHFNSLYYSGITDMGLKYSVDYLPGGGHSLKFGTQWTQHTYSPGALTFDLKFEDEVDKRDYLQNKIQSLESAFYVEDDMDFGRFKMNAGVHYSQFFTDGEFYHSLQPRLGMRYLISGGWALKGSYARMAQYVNLLTNESLSLPTDLWVPATGRIGPQASWQVAAGTAKTLWDDYEISLEGYYKKMNNVLSYKPGVSFILGADTDWQDKITQGNGWSYGLEFLFQKKFGKTTGWVAYTLSWNKRQFEGINRGKIFPFKYDRRHDLSLVISHELSKKWSFSGAWIYGTGNAYSIPDANFSFPANVYPGPYDYSVYSEKNNYRMSDYHRLDISFKKTKQKKRIESTWTFGAYNTYFRKNPFFIMQDYDGKLKEVAILPVIPYVSWGFTF